jgi:tetratricopeptide (TPR) repeat protein
MAEQEEPVRRRVALKIIKLGMDTKAVVARFEAERQALAMMDHPNIAKVLDAGATESGRPYFVMELVQGVPITEFCVRNKLSLRERLDLFLPVCQAIQSAHQKGVIHRDIKPSNVMVTLHYGEPMPKVIDFGVAKATSLKLTEKTVFTQFGTMIGTPAYMSPEQAEMSSLDVDTRTDVYSLGVLLYELLTGSTPFPAERLNSLGFGQMRKVIAEEEPEKPSTRRSTLADAGKVAVAGNPGPAIAHLGGGIPGDLDWIVMKCLEKDRRRRYDTVNGLAMDLMRHLTNEPILARPPNAAYRMQKAFRRNRAAFITAGGVATALVLGLVATSWQSVRATRAERRAAARQADAEAMVSFLTQVFQSPDPARSGYSFTVADALATATRRLETDLAGMPERRTELQATLGETYRAIGLSREAVSLQEKVLDYRRIHSGPEHPDTLRAMTALAGSLSETDRQAEALKIYERVLAIQRRVEGPEARATLSSMAALATAYHYANRFEEAIQLLEPILRLRQKAQGPHHPDTLDAMGALASSYNAAGRKAESLSLQSQVLDLRRHVQGREHPATLFTMANLATDLMDAGQFEEGFALQRELVTLRRKVLGPAHPETLMAMHYQAVYMQSQRPAEAVGLHEQVLALRRKALGPEHPDTIISIHYLAQALKLAAQPEEALRRQEEVVQLRRKSQGAEHPQTLDASASLAEAYLNVGRTEEAVGLLSACAAARPDDSQLARKVAALRAWLGPAREYEAFTRRLVERAAGEQDPSSVERTAKAASLRAASDPAQAEATLRLAQRAVELGRGSAYLPYYQMALGMAEYRHSDFPRAEKTLAALVPANRPEGVVAGTSALYRVMALSRLGRDAEARTLFDAAVTALKPLPADERNPLTGGANADDLIFWLACREAGELLQSVGGSRP